MVQPELVWNETIITREAVAICPSSIVVLRLTPPFNSNKLINRRLKETSWRERTNQGSEANCLRQQTHHTAAAVFMSTSGTVAPVDTVQYQDGGVWIVTRKIVHLKIIIR